MIFALWGRFLALPAGLRNLIGGALALLTLWAAVSLYLGHVRREAVREHEAAIEAQIQDKAQRAAKAAAEQAALDAVANAQADARNADAIARAVASDPAGVKQQAGPATRAVLDSLGKGK